MFKIGEKVVCVNPSMGLKKGFIYTIEAFQYDFLPEVGVYLKELKEPHFCYEWWSYNINRFRKLDHDFAENLLKEISESFKTEAICN